MKKRRGIIPAIGRLLNLIAEPIGLVILAVVWFLFMLLVAFPYYLWTGEGL